MWKFLLLLTTLLSITIAQEQERLVIREPRCPTNEDPFNPTHLAHPSDCTKFYKCESGRAYEFTCPRGHHWNTRMGYCDFPDLANCRLAPRPQAPIVLPTAPTWGPTRTVPGWPTGTTPTPWTTRTVPAWPTGTTPPRPTWPTQTTPPGGWWTPRPTGQPSTGTWWTSPRTTWQPSTTGGWWTPRPTGQPSTGTWWTSPRTTWQPSTTGGWWTTRPTWQPSTNPAPTGTLPPWWTTPSPNAMWTSPNPNAIMPMHCPSVDVPGQNIFYANPFECESYYQCNSGRAVLSRCPNGLQWSTFRNCCDFPNVARCAVAQPYNDKKEDKPEVEAEAEEKVEVVAEE